MEGSSSVASSKAMSFHVHDILNMLSQERGALKISEIEQRIVEKFGALAQFESCAMSGMNSQRAIEFLLMRGKIHEVEPGMFSLDSANSCGH